MNETLAHDLAQKQQAHREAKDSWQWFHLLPILTLMVYIFTPIMSWKLGFPDAIRYVGDLFVVFMIGLLFMRVLVIDRIPAMLMLIIGFAILGGMVATLGGQEIYGTLWGFWLLFRFPLVGLYVYRVPYWPRRMVSWIPKLALILLGIQVLLQIALYLSGQPIGDGVAGTLGPRGTGVLLLIICLTIALTLGTWLVTGKWNLLVIALGLGVVSSTLGEMKLFALGISLLVALALALHLIRGRALRRLVLLILVFAIGLYAYVNTYNYFVADVNGISRLEEYLNSERRDRYLYNDNPGKERFDRNYGVNYAWGQISGGGTNLLVGQGIGTRSVTTALGFVGTGFQESNFGFFTGSSLVVIMMETGLMGLFAIGVLVAGTAAILLRNAGKEGEQDIDVLRYGVVLYTLLWPVWLWYNSVWIMPAPAMLYWFLWGVTMHYSVGRERLNLHSLTNAIRNEIYSVQTHRGMHS